MTEMFFMKFPNQPLMVEHAPLNGQNLGYLLFNCFYLLTLYLASRKSSAYLCDKSCLIITKKKEKKKKKRKKKREE